LPELGGMELLLRHAFSGLLLAPAAKSLHSKHGESSELALGNWEDSLGIRRSFLVVWKEARISHSALECQC